MYSIKFTVCILLLLILKSSYAQINPIIVNGIEFAGNTKTKNEVLLREITFKVGDTLADIADELKKSKVNLVNTNLFHFVSFTSYKVGNLVNIVFSFQERWYLLPYPIFEYAERNMATYFRRAEWDYLNYGLRLEKHNFRGRNEYLEFKTRFGVREQFGIYYMNPRIFNNKNIGFQIDASYFRQKEIHIDILDNKYIDLKSESFIYNEYRALPGILIRKGYYTHHLIYGGVRHFDYPDTIKYLFGNAIHEDFSFITLGYGFYYYKTNYNLYPLRGEKLKVKSEFGKGTTEYFVVDIESSKHYELFKKTYFSIGLNLFFTPFDEFPFYLRKGPGLSWYMRGNEDYIYHNNLFILSRFQLKRELLKPRHFKIKSIKSSKFNNPFLGIYCNIFSEMGYTTNFKTQTNTHELFSLGLGFDFITYYDWINRVEFTINQTGEFLINLHWSYVF